eukprot:PITA_20070
MDTFNCKNSCTRLDELLTSLIQTTQQMCLLEVVKPQNEQNPIYEEFLEILMTGVELVKKCEKSSPFHIFHNLRYGSQIRQLEKEISDFLQYHLPASMFLEVQNLITELKSLAHIYHSQSKDEGKLNETIFKHVSKLTNDAHENAMILQQMVADDDMFDGASDEPPCIYDGSFKPDFVVGIEKNIWNLKKILLQREVSVVGVHGMGGLGKTTMALALCNDQEIKEFFRNNIIFLTVSQSPNLKGILETLWEKITHGKNPKFQNVEEAHRQLQQLIQRKDKPTLVVLDDVWSRVHLEKLLFEGKGHKTLVTTRDRSTIPREVSTQIYELPLLDDADALSLFCLWAFGQRSIPSTADEHLVKQVKAECKGLPLALMVIGSSLHGEPRPTWERAKNKLLNGEPISNYHKQRLLICLQTSIDVLDQEVRECFLDLGSFPEDRKISVDALLDIWVYVRKMEWKDALVTLLELASRNLLNLMNLRPSRNQEINYESASELYFSQHDVMRDLAIYLASQDSVVHRKRLLMPKKEHNFPRKWEFLKDQTFDAQIVSIHTGSMEENQWCDINFCKVEALVLLFSASEYFLPPFLRSMKNLKVLIISNYGCKRANVNGLLALSSLIQLKTIRLERLIVPPFQEHMKDSQNLEKISLSICEGLGNVSNFNNTQSRLKLPTMLDFNLDHCFDLEELPSGICDMASVQRWSITNCHLLQAFPNDLENLKSLKMLRLSACLGIKELPPSIGKLGKLEYLDISLCEYLQELPEEIGELRKLKELDMRECSRLRKLPKSIGGLISLKHVTCDENIGKQWMHVKNFSIMDLQVNVVQEQFNLDWLDG